MISKLKISESSFLKSTQDQLSSEISGEAVILNLNSGIYYGLNETGSVIWQLLQEPREVREIRNLILQEYDVDAEKCDRDITTILEEMLAAGLIEVLDK